MSGEEMSRRRDEFERMAEYYNDRLPIELSQLNRVLAALVADDATAMTYSQFLQLRQAFELVEQTMHRRDMFGAHSDTGKARYRHIAHPEQFPAPAEPAVV
jgi:hypothetical protein